MANRFNTPRVTALDSNGDPVSGARLYFYESGTTSAADTFSDEELSVANANPVVADSAGRFGDIWLSAQDYKVVLTDSDDATIWTADPIRGATDSTGDDYKASTQSPADMTVLVAAGSLFNAVSRAIVGNAVQTSPLVTAPSGNPRHDIVHIDRLTGLVGIDTGSEAASPVDPVISDDKLPVARVTLATTTTEITDSEITDIRELNLLGAIGGEHIQNQTFNYAPDTGAADAYAVSYSPAVTVYAAGQCFAFKAVNANTGSSTLDVDSLGAKTIRKNGGAENLESGDIAAGQIVGVVYDGTNFQMVSDVAYSAPTALEGASLVLLASATPSAAASVDITSAIVAGYKKFLLCYDNLIPASDGAALWLRTSTDNGSSFDSGSYNYAWARREMICDATPAETLYGDDGDAQIILAAAVGSASKEGASGEIWLSDPLNAAVTSRLNFQGEYQSNSGSQDFFSVAGGGHRDDNADVDAFQLRFDTGNIASGEIRLFGLKES